jgi:hypothetical protein
MYLANSSLPVIKVQTATQSQFLKPREELYFLFVMYAFQGLNNSIVT